MSEVALFEEQDLPEAGQSSTQPYKVLARKYRPQTFDDLIGQETMVRILSNAIDKGRLAHAFMLTGVRGIGKTTTARILAKAFNCIGEDGQGSETITPCNVCEHCVSIKEDRHMDVIELDAASRTGVEDVRELIEAVQYRPSSARYKIFIIDEVHMLSKNAFNALLKTLEEPPAHVKFIFATTEIQKIPVTILSRCQRFDLKRIDLPTLVNHFKKIAELEAFQIEEEAATLIARAAEGSVRDGLSILDQASAFAQDNIVTTEQATEMLGLKGRERLFELVDGILQGAKAQTLSQVQQYYDQGVDPVLLCQELLGILHLMSRVKALSTDQNVSENITQQDFVAAQSIVKSVGLGTLMRLWQALLAGYEDIKLAPMPQAALEMIVLRLMHIIELPDLDVLLQQHNANDAAMAEKKNSKLTPPQQDHSPDPLPINEPAHQAAGEEAVDQKADLQAKEKDQSTEPPNQLKAFVPEEMQDLQIVVNVLQQNKEAVLASQVRLHWQLVKVDIDRASNVVTLDIATDDHSTPKKMNVVQAALNQHTSYEWQLAIVQKKGKMSLIDAENKKKQHLQQEFSQSKLMHAIHKHYPNAKVTNVKLMEKPNI